MLLLYTNGHFTSKSVYFKKLKYIVAEKCSYVRIKWNDIQFLWLFHGLMILWCPLVFGCLLEIIVTLLVLCCSWFYDIISTFSQLRRV